MSKTFIINALRLHLKARNITYKELAHAIGLSEPGTHDLIGGTWSGLYDKQGNAERGRGAITSGAQEAWSASGAIVGATPFAAAQGLPPEVWKAIGVLLKGGM